MRLRLWLLILGTLSLFSVASGAPTTPKGTRWALLIGVTNSGQPAFPELRFAGSDARLVAQALIRSAAFPAGNVIVLASDRRQPPDLERPTRSRVLSALRAVADRAGPDDTFLFFFSGHGFTQGGQSFLALADTEPKNAETLRRSALASRDLQQTLFRIRAGQQVYLLDSQHGNPGSDSKRALAHGADHLPGILLESATHAANIAVLTASGRDEQGLEDAQLGRSLFAHHLVEAFEGKAVRAWDDLTVNATADYVRSQIGRTSQARGARQTVSLHAHSVGQNRIVLIPAREVEPVYVTQWNLIERAIEASVREPRNGFRTAASQALEALRLLPPSTDTAGLYRKLGRIAYAIQEAELARTCFEGESRTWEALGGESLDLAASLNDLGMTHRAAGSLTLSREVLDRARVQFHRLAPGSEAEVTILRNLAEVRMAVGEDEAGKGLLEEAIAIANRSIPRSSVTAAIVNSLGSLAFRRGDRDSAERWFEAALQILDQIRGDPDTLRAVLSNLREVAIARSDLAGAEVYQNRIMSLERVLAGRSATIHILTIGDPPANLAERIGAVPSSRTPILRLEEHLRTAGFRSRRYACPIVRGWDRTFLGLCRQIARTASAEDRIFVIDFASSRSSELFEARNVKERDVDHAGLLRKGLGLLPLAQRVILIDRVSSRSDYNHYISTLVDGARADDVLSGTNSTVLSLIGTARCEGIATQAMVDALSSPDGFPATVRELADSTGRIAAKLIRIRFSDSILQLPENLKENGGLSLLPRTPDLG